VGGAQEYDGSEVAHRQGGIEVLRDVIEGGAELALT
jgi:hypothetical protein